MKAQKSKSNKWIWLIAGLAVLLVIVGVLLAIFLRPSQSGPAGGSASGAELYWNVDGEYYMSISDMEGLSGRTAAEDGNYYILFAHDGQQVELQIVDKQLVNYIDTMDAVGLVLDADGIVVDAADPQSVATEVAKGFFVQSVNSDCIVVNSSVTMNGMEMEIEITEQTGIYDVSADAEMVGQSAQCELFDTVTIYADENDVATHVYITEHAVDSEVYWRTERCYNTSTSLTTREPDADGVYTIQFSKDGELVELKCKDVTLVNRIDAYSIYDGEMGLAFDEEGFIVDIVDVPVALRGKQLCDNFHVTEINGDTITATGLVSGNNQGKTVTFTMNDTCKIFMCCEGCNEEHTGEAVPALQMLDRFSIYTDLEGNVLQAYITRRMVDCPMYFNLQQKYNWTTLETSRVPDENGYYVYDMVVEGKPVTVKTKDKAMATRIDSQYDCCMGLVLDGDIIKKVYDPKCIAGEWSLGGTQLYVTALAGQIFTLSASTDFSKTYNGILSENCKIYDMTGFYGVEKGSTTTLQLYDRATCYKNPYGEVEYVFITERYVENTKIYYSLTRKYNTTDAVTTREPDADGWYIFDMVCEGKQVTVKTKNKSLASYMDMQSAPVMALKVGSDGVVKNAYPVISALKFGKKAAGYHYVNKIERDGTYTTYWYSSGERFESSVVQKLADDCVVYNVSTLYDSYRGEKTTLRPNDQIQAIATNPNGESTVIFVMNRTIDAPLYWNMQQKYNYTTKETTREPDADGWYVYNLAVNGEVKQFKTKDKALATSVDSYGSAFTLVADGDVITNVYPATNAKGINSPAGSRYDVMSIDGNKLKLVLNRPSEASRGATLELTIAESCVVYDVSKYAKDPGGEAKIEVGDRVVCYIDSAKNVVYCYIVYKNTHTAGYMSYCAHCDQEVFWNPYEGSVAAVDAHYYLAYDMDATYQISIGSTEKSLDIVLDLNGHTFTPTRRAFLVYGTLSIVDTVGGGRIEARNIAGGNGSCIMIAGSGTLNLYGGTLSVADDCVKPQMGGVLYVGSGTTFNMYGGEVSGGAASQSGNNIAVLGGTFNMSGGKIAGDVAVDAGSKVVLSGKPVITGGKDAGLDLAGGVKITMGELKQGASICVSAAGVFTEENKNAEAYASYFKPFSEYAEIIAEKNVLRYSVPGALELDAEGKAVCPVCNENVEWTAVSGSSWSSRIGDHKSGHYYLASNVSLPADVNNFATAAKNSTLCLHLNGKNLTYGSRIAIAYDNSTLNIMGSGTVTAVPYTGTGAGNVAALYVGATGTLNLYGGTYTTTDSTRPVVLMESAGGVVNVYEGAVIKGIDDVSAVEITDGTFNVCGGTVHGGIDAAAGKVTLSGVSTVTGENGELTDNIAIGESAKLVVKSDYDGVASVAFENLSGNIIPSSNGACEGEFTGKLYLETDGSVLTSANFQDNSYDPAASEGKLVLENGMAVCPVCGGEAVEWTAVSGSSWSSRIGDSKSGHYYIDGEVSLDTYVNNFATARTNSTLCIHLNGGSLTYGSRIAVAYSGSTINIMGAGTVTVVPYTGTSGGNDAGLYVANAGTLNLYGGTYTTTDASRPLFWVSDASGTLNIHEGVVIEGVEGVPVGYITSGSLNITDATVSGIKVDGGNVTLSGDAVISGAGMTLAEGVKLTLGELTENASILIAASNGVFTNANENASAYAGYFLPMVEGDSVVAVGNVLNYVDADAPEDDGEEEIDLNKDTLTLDANGNGYCYACGEIVQWTDLNALSNPRLGYIADTENSGAHYHYYLSADLVYTRNDQYAERYHNINCLHLNGYALSFNSRMYISGGAALNIIGNGSVTGSCDSTSITNSAVLQACNGGVINLYGGTYNCTNSAYPTVNVIARSQLNIYDGVQINGGVKVDVGTVTLSGYANVDAAAVSVNGKLSVAGDWTGTAGVSFASLGEDNTIPEANGSCEDVFTGKLYLDAPGYPEIIGQDGLLVVTDNYSDPYSTVLELNDQQYALCPVCNDTVQWTAVSGSKWDSRIGNSKSGHYYLDGDVSLPTYVNNFATAAKNSTLCIHLNGNNLTYGSRIAVAYEGSTVNIMGAGTVTAIPYTGTETGNDAALVVESAGTLNLYSGTYTTTDTTRPVLLVKNASAVVNVMGTAKLVGVENGAGTVQVTAGTVSLGGVSCVDAISVSETGKLNIKADWTGKAVAAFAVQITDNTIPAANGTSEGTFTGELRLTTEDGQYIVGTDGGLMVTETLDDEE